MTLFADIYRGRRVLVTGHTGFKGSWLSLWLKELGAEVSGIALDPEHDRLSHWKLAGPGIVNDIRIDIRDPVKVALAVERVNPEIVFHLAAQPLVRRSYFDPLTSWQTNVLGTANLLEACRSLKALKAAVLVTTDKCYENQEWVWGYRETDSLGGRDPYSASKAAMEILVSSYRHSFFDEDGKTLLATARAGNVIGGGDWSEDRLIPDLVRAVGDNTSLRIRSPKATRPWQHVLESLSGYLLLGQSLFEGHRKNAKAWNFGPAQEGNKSVEEVLRKLVAQWPAVRWVVDDDAQPHEAKLLYLDSTMAQRELLWRPIWDLDQALEATATWYRVLMDKDKVLSREQIASYVTAAQSANVAWSEV